MFLTIKLYTCETELFEIDWIICIKMDLALNNLQRLICHKTQPTNIYCLEFWDSEKKLRHFINEELSKLKKNLLAINLAI